MPPPPAPLRGGQAARADARQNIPAPDGKACCGGGPLRLALHPLLPLAGFLCLPFAAFAFALGCLLRLDAFQLRLLFRLDAFLLFLAFALLLLDEAAAFGSLLLHELFLRQLLNQDLADLNIGKIVVLRQLLHNLMNELRLEGAFPALGRGRDHAVRLVLKVALQNQVLEQDIAVNILLKALVNLRILLHDADCIADVVVAAQEFKQL